MSHVDDYLDSDGADPIAKEFLAHARRPAADKDHRWLASHMPTISWRGKRYLCSGASRMGDVWLRHFGSLSHYDHRVDIDELSGWGAAPVTPAERAAALAARIHREINREGVMQRIDFDGLADASDVCFFWHGFDFGDGSLLRNTPFARLGAELRAIALGNREGAK